MRFIFTVLNAQDLTNRFLDYQEKNRRMSVHTVLAYRTDLDQFIDFLTSAYKTDDMTQCESNHVRAWMSHLISNGISNRSVHRKISTLRSFYRYLRKQEIIHNDPLAKVVMPKVPRKIVKDIPAADLQSMFKNYPWQEEENGYRDQLILLLLYSTGMRLAELIGLKKGDIDLKRQSITVTGKRNKQRVIPIHPELFDALSDFINTSGSQYLIGTSTGQKAYPVMVYRIVNKYLRLFSSALKTSPHVLRHSFATHMLNNGANLMAIKELLGHTSLSATQVYTKNSFEKLKAIHKLHPRN